LYISTPCPKCKKHVCIDLTITEKLTPATAESTILDVDIVDTCTASDLARDVLNVVSDHIYDGISTHELCRILHDKFKILEQAERERNLQHRFQTHRAELLRYPYSIF